MDKKISRFFLTLFFMLCVAVPVSAAYTQTFDPSSNVVVNQSLAQDPTGGQSSPLLLWVIAGIAGLCLTIFSLTRGKTNRMDYEVNIILSVIAWPFFGYFAWGGITSVDYVAGVGMAASSTGTIAMITQHILYSFWLLGWIGIGGFLASVAVTALLASQYKLFNDTEASNTAAREQQERME
jgi:hypothetical protein